MEHVLRSFLVDLMDDASPVWLPASRKRALSGANDVDETRSVPAPSASVVPTQAAQPPPTPAPAQPPAPPPPPPPLYLVEHYASEPPHVNVPVPPPSDACLQSLDDSCRGVLPLREHASGAISFQILHSGHIDRGRGYPEPPSREQLEFLISCKNVFSSAIRDMPLEYVTRIVFDRHHRTLALMKGNKVIGGICYRGFWSLGLLEVVFCAVSSHVQLKGYGSYIMNQLKTYAIRNGCLTIMTFADNDAIGYFSKQGFSSTLTLPKAVMDGVIKEYTGGIMMQCTLHASIPYHILPVLLARQRQHLQAALRRKDTQPIMSGLTVFDQGQSFIPIADIPGLREAGWSSTSEATTPAAAAAAAEQDRALQAWLKQILRDIRAHADSWPFREPVNRADAPDYYDVIIEPMDLKMVAQRVKDKSYSTRDAFVRDIQRMLDNCRHYNNDTTEFFKCADRLEQYFKTRLVLT